MMVNDVLKSLMHSKTARRLLHSLVEAEYESLGVNENEAEDNNVQRSMEVAAFSTV